MAQGFGSIILVETELWHRTTEEAAKDILANGFPQFIGPAQGTPVHVSNDPLGAGRGKVLLHLLLDATDSELAEFEVAQDGKPYRVWNVPAAFLNSHAVVKPFDESAVEDD